MNFTQHINTSKKLIEILTFLQEQGFVFRGQENSKWPITPQGSRKANKRLFKNIFRCHGNINDTTIKQWKENLPRALTNRYPSSDFNNLCAYVLNLMVYNYAFCQFFKKHHLPPRLFNELLSPSQREIINHYLARGFNQEHTFQDLIHFYAMTCQTLIALDERVLQAANPPSEMTGLDQAYAQHYCFPSYLLDWTRNYSIAIHFAIRKIKREILLKNEKLIIVAFKPLSNESPIKIVLPDSTINNTRVKKQEGLFTEFTDPCSFFLRRWRFPAIEDYAGHSSFLLKAYSLDINPHNMQALEEHLSPTKINDTALGLTEKNRYEENWNFFLQSLSTSA